MEEDISEPTDENLTSLFRRIFERKKPITFGNIRIVDREGPDRFEIPAVSTIDTLKTMADEQQGQKNKCRKHEYGKLFTTDFNSNNSSNNFDVFKMTRSFDILTQLMLLPSAK